MDGGVPEYVFTMFQGKFAIITPALIAGAFAERVKFKGYVVFIALCYVDDTHRYRFEKTLRFKRRTVQS